MTLPLYGFDLISDSQGLAAALVLGFGFGWFLERAGFGSARKLAAQFYLHDMMVSAAFARARRSARPRPAAATA